MVLLMTGAKRTVAPYQRALVVVAAVAYYRHRVELLVGIFLQTGLVEPALHARTSFIGLDESDRDIETAREHPAEEVASCRLVADIPHVGIAPLAVGVGEGFHAHHTRNLAVAQTTVVGCVGHNIIIFLHRTAVESFHRHLHIALSGTYPHVAGEDIAYRRGTVAVVEGDGQGLETGCRSRNLNNEFTVLTRRSVEFLSRPAGRHGDFRLRLGPAPKVSVGVLLDNHTVGQQMWQAHLGLR